MKKTTVKPYGQDFKSCTSNLLSEQESRQVMSVFSNGGLIVYPTETLYALGADPFNEEAVDRIYTVKSRPGHMPISIAVSDIEMMNRVACVNALAETIYKHLLPGPVTLLLKKRACVPSIVSSGSDKIGIRVPNHPVALKIIDIVGPITSTSANLHGKPDATNLDIAKTQLGDAVELYLDYGECEYKMASTVVDISDSSIKIIRSGVLSPDKLTVLADMEH